MPRALVLAAGLGSRIRPISGDLPKPLIPFGGAPILARNLAWLWSGGVREVWINLHHRPDAIRDAIGDGGRFGLSVNYSFEPQLLGTAGALANLSAQLDATTLVVYGDNLVSLDLRALISRHLACGAPATLALFDQARHLHTGIAGGRVTLDASGRVTAFLEGAPSPSPSGLVNAGVYVLEPEVYGFIAPVSAQGRCVDFGRDVFPAMLERGAPLQGHVIEEGGYCLGLDTPHSFAAGAQLLKDGRIAP